MHRSIKTCLGLGSLFLLVFALTPAAAQAAPPTLEGSWRATSVLDGATDGVESLFTFARGGTLIASNNNAGTSNGHGTWERVAGRTFAASNLAFIYDADGVAAQILATEITFDVAPGGATFTATFEATIQTLDGTVLSIATGTATGTRIGG